uniref:DUF4604 domain-containing protein n=1 Tax=Heterorhabditis bacteriophora TaxID=37862 RepID=A0A1I7XTI2_HETBA
MQFECYQGLLRARKKKFLDSSLDGSNATTPGSVYSVSPVESPDELTAPPPNDIILNGKDKPVSEKEIKENPKIAEGGVRKAKLN